MKIHKKLNKIIGAYITILLVISSITTIAMGTLDEIDTLNKLPYSENIDGAPYRGHLRIYIVEIISRWNDYSGEPYHFGFMDFAYDDSLSIDYLDTFTDSITWSGDVEEDNIMVMAATFNPVAHQGFSNPPAGKPFEAHYVDAAAGATPGNTGFNTVTENFTHTVFIEEGTATWCSNCPNMAEALYSIYESEDYPFYYIALVDNKSAIAANRLRKDYNLYGFPTAYFDGGKEVLLGGISSEAPYRTRIESCGVGDVHELNLTLSVEWLRDGEIQIDISITNYEEITYPIVQIGDINGGILGVKTVIRNIGGGDATDVEWSINVEGGILGLIDVSTEETIEILVINGEETVKTKGIIFGLGLVDITVTADTATKMVQGLILGPFIIIL
ncbi:MAG: hypothetical protein JSW06_04550 [Thermoplasmatales archaeon]|nr:MAG: hypothetical protein JSW06_04550 [Thermoplasmatales archaeon]